MITMIMMNLKNTSFHCSFCFFVFLFLCSSKSRTNYEELCKQLLYRLNKSEHYYPLSPNFFLTSSLIHLFGQ